MQRPLAHIGTQEFSRWAVKEELNLQQKQKNNKQIANKTIAVTASRPDQVSQ